MIETVQNNAYVMIREKEPYHNRFIVAINKHTGHITFAHMGYRYNAPAWIEVA